MHSLFNNKGNAFQDCTVAQNGSVHTLYSYNTRIAEYNAEDNSLQLSKWYSNTTQKHLNAFLKLHGLSKMTKSEIANFINQF